MSWKISTEGERYYGDAESMPGAQKAHRLAAAAPELLEALEEALADWEDDHFDEEYPFRLMWADKARAAIAKAKGEE